MYCLKIGCLSACGPTIAPTLGHHYEDLAHSARNIWLFKRKASQAEYSTLFNYRIASKDTKQKWNIMSEK